MTDVTPSGNLSKSLENVRTLIAASTTFQDWVGAENAAAAKADLHLCEADPLSVSRPCGVIYFPDTDTLRLPSIAGGQGNLYAPQGKALVSFWADAAVGDGIDETEANYELTFANEIGDILSDIMALAGTDSYINVVECGVLKGPHRAARKEEHGTPYFWIELELRWEGF